MENLNVISGLPRSGSTLLCQLLNMNPANKATQTSPILEMLISQQGVFSHSPSFKAVDRMEMYNAFGDAQEAFIQAYYKTLYPDTKNVFDKNRGWPMHLMKLDEVLDHDKTKVLWTYRNPLHVVSSMEARHRKYPLMQFVEEQQQNVNMSTMEARINTWCGDGGIVSFPVFALHDAIEMLNEDRIFIIDYKELCINTQEVLNQVHEFLGIEPYEYDAKHFTDLKQTTVEHDNLYNYKYPHDIVEGKVEYKEPDFELSPRFKKMIDERFQWLNDYAKKQIDKRKKKPGRHNKKKENNQLQKVT